MTELQNTISDCLRGDQEACKILYEQHIAYTYGICQRYGVAQGEMKDQIQVIFSAMFKSLAQFDDSKASFKTWFTRLCIHKILDERRKKERHLNIEELTTDYNHTSNQPIGEDQLDRNYLLRILSKMPEQYQHVFNLFIMDGYKHKEIAKMLNITEGSSRIILRRARTWAQKELANYMNYS